MCSAEGIVDIVVIRLGETIREIGIIGLFAGMEAEVLQQQQGALLGIGRRRVEAIRDEKHRSAEGGFQCRRHRFQRVRRVAGALGLAEMGARGHDTGPFGQPAQSRQCGDDACVVQDHAVTHRDVEVETGQHPCTVHILELGQGREAHPYSLPTMYSIRSTQRRA